MTGSIHPSTSVSAITGSINPKCNVFLYNIKQETCIDIISGTFANADEAVTIIYTAKYRCKLKILKNFWSDEIDDGKDESFSISKTNIYVSFRSHSDFIWRRSRSITLTLTCDLLPPHHQAEQKIIKKRGMSAMDASWWISDISGHEQENAGQKFRMNIFHNSLGIDDFQYFFPDQTKFWWVTRSSEILWHSKCEHYTCLRNG